MKNFLPTFVGLSVIKIVYISLCIFCAQSYVHASGISNAISGMGQTFGAAPVGYAYSFEVWSDANVPVYVGIQELESFMGAFSPKTSKPDHIKSLPSIFQASGSSASIASYHGQNYYFNIFIATDLNVSKKPMYTQSLTQLPAAKGDDSIYYYHVFNKRTYEKGTTIHPAHVELVGFANPSAKNSADQGSVTLSSDLASLAFYNSSPTDVQVSLQYGQVPLTLTIEKYSYLSIDIPTSSEKIDADSNSSIVKPIKKISLRPNNLTFTGYNADTKKYDIAVKSLKLAPQGFANSPYTIEIFKDEGKKLDVCIQGITSGNYDQAVFQRARDATPVPCTFWYQSVAQTNPGKGFIDLAGQVWLVYQGADSVFQSKVDPGQVVSLDLIRPLLSQGDQFLYCVYLTTNDDAKALQFITNFSKGLLTSSNGPVEKFKNDVTTQSLTVQESNNLLTSDQQVATLMGSLNVTNGAIADPQSGVSGYLLGADIFTAKGMGYGNYYYVLAPSIENVGNLVSIVVGACDPTKLSTTQTDPTSIITPVVESWLNNYMKDPADTALQVQNYIKKYGNAQVVDVSGNLTTFGKQKVQSICSGKVSLQFPPLKLSTVTNQYVYDFGAKAPDKMPNTVIQLITTQL